MTEKNTAEEKQRRGRPRVGIVPSILPDGKRDPAGTSLVYRLVLYDLIADNERLAKALKNPENILMAVNEFRSLPLERAEDQPDKQISAVKALDDFCDKHLSKYGWNRVQANVRDRRYAKGAAVVQDGRLKRRQRIKPAKLSEETSVRLVQFAKNKKISVSEAVDLLLDSWSVGNEEK